MTPALSHRGGAGRLKLTAGLGWGRLGSNGSIGSISGTRPGFVAGDTGGELAYDQWFRGEMAPFAGIEWLPNDRWGFKAEYSSDAYVLETGAPDVFERKSSFNFGAEYQARPGLRLGAYYLYGSEIGVTADPAQSQTPDPADAGQCAGAGGTAQQLGHQRRSLEPRLGPEHPRQDHPAGSDERGAATGRAHS
ncbi:YjbH domain-containing protein [Phaeobacter inhibens]|uniref:YjbH domain-containing protein n=1 Tax=Phaeobacter inhibens TaxID=221822 RepID=UPI0035CCE897